MAKIKTYRINSYSIIIEDGKINLCVYESVKGSTLTTFEIGNFAVFLHGVLSKNISLPDFGTSKEIIEYFNKEISNIFTLYIYDKSDSKFYVSGDVIGLQPVFFSKSVKKIIFSTLVFDIVEYLNIKLTINPKGLINHFGFGYCPPNTNFIFQNVYRVLPGELICLDINTLNYTTTLYSKLPDINSTNENYNVEDLYKTMVAALKNIEKPFIGITSGKDSLLISSLYSKMNKCVNTGNFGDKDTNDVIQGERLAKTCGFKYSYIKNCEVDEFESYSDKIAFFSSGLATSSYVDMLKMAEKLIMNDEVFIMGEGGECIRHFFMQNDNHTTNFYNYITPADSLSQVLSEDYQYLLKDYPKYILTEIDSKYELYTTEYFIDFYRRYRMPGNFSLRTLLLNAVTDKYSPFFDFTFTNKTYGLNPVCYKNSNLHKEIIRFSTNDLIDFFEKKNFYNSDDTQQWAIRFPLLSEVFYRMIEDVKFEQFGLSKSGLKNLIDSNIKNPGRGIFLILRVMTFVRFIKMVDNKSETLKFIRLDSTRKTIQLV